MKRFLFLVFLTLVIAVGGAFAYNFSWFDKPHREGPPRLIAHRGVHQTFNPEGVENDTCTATRIDPPTHSYLENTIPSMRAAFGAGAEVVELDVHLTPDGQFAVMHDWTLDCRTNGSGVTEQTSMDVLKTLDVGYGYTADGGATWPLRGKGVGMMPTLSEVFAANPGKSFFVNFKSRRSEEGQALTALIAAHPEWRSQLWGVYGGTEPTDATLQAIPDLTGYTRESMSGCAKDYMLTGWTGQVPTSCRHTTVVIPSNIAWAVWGWPHKFTRRMEAAGSTVILIGPYSNDEVGSRGIDSLEQLANLPKGFGGYVWTNRIELLGPATGAGQRPPVNPETLAPVAPPEPVIDETAELAAAQSDTGKAAEELEGHYTGDSDGC